MDNKRSDCDFLLELFARSKHNLFERLKGIRFARSNWCSCSRTSRCIRWAQRVHAQLSDRWLALFVSLSELACLILLVRTTTKEESFLRKETTTAVLGIISRTGSAIFRKSIGLLLLFLLIGSSAWCLREGRISYVYCSLVLCWLFDDNRRLLGELSARIAWLLYS